MIKHQQLTVGLRNVGFFGWKVSPPILLLSKEKCVAPKPTLLKPTAVMPHLLKSRYTKNSVKSKCKQNSFFHTTTLDK